MQFSELEIQIQARAREVAQSTLAPVAAELEREERFPKAELKRLGALGLLAVAVPQELGGSGAGALAYSLAMQEVAQGCASTAVTMAVNNMACEVIAHFGSEAQKQRYCPELARGFVAPDDDEGAVRVGAFALSEPGAGSDPGAMTTTAVLEGDEWVIRGQKQWITSGAFAGVMIVWARTEDREAAPGARGLSAFLVPGDAPGLTALRAEEKMGIRASNTVPLDFDDVRVPQSALLGQRGGGFKIAMMALDGGRIGIASQALGIARAALAEAQRTAKRQGTVSQAIQWRLADMLTELDAAHLLTLRAASRKRDKLPFSREASMAKLYATEAAWRITQRALEVVAELGFETTAVERHLRDVRVTMIYEGTSEVQRLVIARQLLSE